jgi:hypothetical protein
MDEITKQIILEKVGVQIADYKDHADELLNLINLHFEKENDRFKLICKAIIERYYVGLLSIKSLIETYKFYKPMRFSYALILRTLLLDFLTIEFLYFKKESSDSEFVEAIKSVNFISAREANQYCDALQINGQGFRNYISNLFPENFSTNENGDKVLMKGKKVTPWDMADYLKTSKYPYGSDVYKIYSEYSNVAHFSDMTILHRNSDDENEIREFLWSMFYIFHGHDRCLEVIDFYPKCSIEIVQKRSYFLDLINQL